MVQSKRPVLALLVLPKMLKGKKAKGKKLAPAPAVRKKQEVKKVVNSLFEKRPKNLALDRTSSPKGPHSVC